MESELHHPLQSGNSVSRIHKLFRRRLWDRAEFKVHQNPPNSLDLDPIELQRESSLQGGLTGL